MQDNTNDKKISKIFWLIPGYRRFSNVVWFSSLTLAGLGFFIAGSIKLF